MRTRLALAALPLALVAACGGSSSSSPKAVTQTTTTTATETKTETETVTSTPTETAPTDTSSEDANAMATDDSADATTSDDAADSSSTEEPSAAGGGEVEAAVSSARSYLDSSAFSKQGLIDQLSSEYGDKYPLAVATQAVNSLTDVNWNAQAAKSAQNYLDGSSFSCAGLKDQLSSAYGDKFTLSQAAYGASQTSVCK